ncbi:MAG: hypothetical protein ACI945_001776 [Pseudohongiellaceae bacterium]
MEPVPPLLNETILHFLEWVEFAPRATSDRS